MPWLRGFFSREGFFGLLVVLVPPVWGAFTWADRGLVAFLGYAKVTPPPWLTSAVFLAVGGGFILHAIWQEERKQAVTEGWLAEALYQRHGFDEVIAKAQALECTYFLGDHRIWDRRSAEAMLSSPYVRATLRAFYAEILNREPDPEGYCQWGSMLFRAPRLERKRMEEHVRERMEKRKLQGWE